MATTVNQIRLKLAAITQQQSASIKAIIFQLSLLWLSNQLQAC
jgi:hypothetical protein